MEAYTSILRNYVLNQLTVLYHIYYKPTLVSFVNMGAEFCKILQFVLWCIHRIMGCIGKDLKDQLVPGSLGYLKGVYKTHGKRLLTWVYRGRTRGDDFKLKKNRFRLDIRKKILL